MADIYDLLAGKGRGEDKHLRMVDGEISHVNEVERDAIDTYGLGGEIFTKSVGTGDINPNTGLPEYDWKKNIWGNRKKSKNSPHNKSHDKFKNTSGREGKDKQHKTAQELSIEKQQAATTAQGASLLDSGGRTIGGMGVGQESLTAEQYQGMTPQQIVDDIFTKQYNNQVPPDMNMTEAEFKIEIAGTLKNMPQFKGVDPKALALVEEGKDIAVEQTSITAQAGAEQVGSAQRGVYGGMGAGMRAGVGAGSKLGQTYGLGLQTADLGFRKGAYGLEQAAGADWESDYGSFLGTLPSAV
tara:strand:+ start:176 stop:1069 length:894 start_codon:yes stop_codon:yes gene_type:complete